MDAMYCLVDSQGTVYGDAAVTSFSDVARQFGIDENACHEYQFDLATRRMVGASSGTGEETAVRDYVNALLGSPERLMAYAREGHLPKKTLGDLLQPGVRQRYLDACGLVERSFTDACTAKGEPCLESGCSVEHADETCLQPLLNAGIDYYKACAEEWLPLFRNPANRIDAWRK